MASNHPLFAPTTPVARGTKSSLLLRQLDQVKLIGNTLVWVPPTPLRRSLSSPSTAELLSVNPQAKGLGIDFPEIEFKHSNLETPECSPQFLLRAHSFLEPQIADEIHDFPDKGQQQKATPTTLTSLTADHESPSAIISPTRMVRGNRASKWATAADMRPDPDTKKYNRCDGWASDVPSDQADIGWGDEKLHGDRSGNEHNLADFDGSWAPPPIDWNDRPSFHDRQFQQRMDEWVQKINFTREPIKCTETELASLDGDIAPYTWIPTEIDGSSPECWWVDHMTSPEVESGTHPWWESYASPTSEALARVTAPIAKLDVTDSDMIKSLKTAKQAMEELNNKHLRRLDNQRKAREERRAVAIEAANYHPPPNQYAPRLNIYLRPANGHDIPQITEIYNHYILNTIFCPELTPLSTIQVRERWTDVNDNRLPFLVAVDRSAKGNRRKRPGRVAAATQNDHIIGFAYADDYNDIRGMYRYTIEVEIFVRPESLRHGVGRCLMDKMMYVLDPHYATRGGYDFVGDETRYGSGGARVVGSVVVNVPYNAADKTQVNWLQGWLNQWEFKKAGEMEEVGYKLSTVVNQAIFLKKTGSKLEPWAQ